MVPEELRCEEERTDDFQDIEMWKVLTVRTAQEVIQKYNKHLIVPMTLYKTENFEYIYNGLKSIDNDIFHFCLVASEETIQKRIENRGDTYGDWYQQQTKKCVPVFRENKFQ